MRNIRALFSLHLSLSNILSRSYNGYELLNAQYTQRTPIKYLKQLVVICYSYILYEIGRQSNLFVVPFSMHILSHSLDSKTRSHQTRHSAHGIFFVYSGSLYMVATCSTYILLAKPHSCNFHGPTLNCNSSISNNHIHCSTMMFVALDCALSLLFCCCWCRLHFCMNKLFERLD